VIAPGAGAGSARLTLPGVTCIGFVRAWIVDAGGGTPFPGRSVLTATGSGFTCGAVFSTGAVATIVGGMWTRFGATGFPPAKAAPPTAVIAPGTPRFA
jgi:hypothetical protein